MPQTDMGRTRVRGRRPGDSVIAPYGSVRRVPSQEEHPDIPGTYLNYYVNRIGLMVPLWPAEGPLRGEEDS